MISAALFLNHISGNLKDEDSVLAWLLERKEAEADVIELVDRKMLEVLLEDVDHLAVFFCKRFLPFVLQLLCILEVH